MESFEPTQKRLILVCCNQKDPADKTLCGNMGSLELHAELKEFVRGKGMQKEIRVVKSGCLDYCGKGPIICVEPEHAWYMGMKKEDLDSIKKKWIDSSSSASE